MSEQDQYIDAQRQMAEEGQLRELASTQAASPEALRGLRDKRFLEILGDADIVDDDDSEDDLDALLATETSRVNVLANLDDDEYFAHRILNQNVADRVVKELIPLSGPGSKCTGEFRAIMLGDPAEELRPRRTPEMVRRVHSALGEEGVRTAMQSLAKDGRAFDGVTKIHAVAETEQSGNTNGAGSSGGGLFARTKNLLFG